LWRLSRQSSKQLNPVTLATHFITVDVSLEAGGADLVRTIEAALTTRGEPLRWAITQVDVATQTATVEAVITTGAGDRSL
jgi:hypothetical protein